MRPSCFALLRRLSSTAACVVRARRLCASKFLAGASVLAACLCLLAPQLAAQLQSSGQAPKLVAQFELPAPDVESFVLRGTLPVPRGTYLDESLQSPFGIRGFDGLIKPAQVEIVSRYPLESDGADVVELLARVKLPPNSVRGKRVRFDVLLFESPLVAKNLGQPNLVKDVPGSIAALLFTPGALVLRAQDCYGNWYLADLSPNAPGLHNSPPLREGPVALQSKSYTTLQYVPDVELSAGPALPHFFGVHSYMTVWSGEELLSLDLRLNNGASGLDPLDPSDDPLGKVYYKSIELLIPQGWSLSPDIRDPNWGEPYVASTFWNAFPIVQPSADGSLHLMPSQGQFHRRMTIAPIPVAPHAEQFAQMQGQAFCVPGTTPTGESFWSWFNPATARYFPQRQRLPELDFYDLGQLRGELSADFFELYDQLTSGSVQGYPLASPQMGHARPWGVPYGGMTGGDEIYLYDGLKVAAATSQSGYRSLALTHRALSERQPSVLYDKDGDPAQLEDWLIETPTFTYAPFFFYMKLLAGNDPFGFDQAPTFQQEWVQAQGLQPSYEDQLLAYEAIDQQHLVRYTRAAKALAWLGNDALAKDDLAMQAELMHMSYHQYYNSSYKHVASTGLLSDQLEVAANPGVGFTFGRGEAWGMDAVAACYALSDNTWRSFKKPWIDSVLQVLVDGQSSCSGVIQSTVYEKILGGKYHARQSIEQAITEHALVGLLETVYRDADTPRALQLEEVLRLSTSSMLGYPAWSSTLHGPWSQLALGPKEQGTPPFCGWLPDDGFSAGVVDKYQCWSSFAYGYQLTGNQAFLDAASEMLGPQGWGALETLSNLENRAALLSLIQTLDN